MAGAESQWRILVELDRQTAMVLFGLVDYLAASQELNADFDVDVCSTAGPIGKHHFTAADAVSGADLSIDVAAAQLHPRQ